MKRRIAYLLLLSFLITLTSEIQAQLKTVEVTSFNKVIVSPHIEVTFREGNKEEVAIDESDVPLEKIKVEVKGKTLRIYLEDAKFLTKRKKHKTEYGKSKHPIYNGTEALVTISYRSLKRLSVRGEQTITLESPLEQQKFRLVLYGESKVVVQKAKLNKLRTSIYGASELDIESGAIETQKYTAYGESRVNTLGVENDVTRITAYGESDFKLNVSDKIKLTAFGEALVRYDGRPNINRGIIIGKASIRPL
ncbi:MAG: head GIN domain-containing protein [Bacteroidota bacterium]